ncbi:hypothetical protein D915_001615 [Fasciola hepatica]|uniref:Uncharacterized protein n=1 Tax=Fasciola hepatica TaxID=6192 RepID=A0A4E0S380_FASHE|nr:hypothetical protein D915_001615 [Fasciola hepatica]
MLLIHQAFTVLLLSLITFESGLVNSYCSSGCNCGCNQPDVFETFLSNAFFQNQPCRPTTPPRPKILFFQVTDELNQWLLANMADSVCSTPNNLFVVRINSTLPYQRYNTQVIRIDSNDYKRWNSILSGPLNMPTLTRNQYYLLYGESELPICVNSTNLNLNCMPTLTAFVPLRNVSDTIEQVYDSWVNSTNDGTATTPDSILCSRLQQLVSLIRTGGVV